MPLLTRRRLLGVAIESVPGTAISMTSDPEDFVLFPVYDAVMQPNIVQNDRDNVLTLGAVSSIPGFEGGTCTFRVYPYSVANGSDTPQWAQLLLPACGLVEDSGVFSPVSEAPGSNVKTLTLALYVDGVVKTLRGCAGNAVFTMNAGEIVSVEFTFTGIWVTPATASVPAKSEDFEDDVPIAFKGATFTLADVASPIQAITIDLGNEVTLGEHIANSSGYSFAMIGGRRVTGTMNPEAVAAVARLGKLTSGATAALSLAFGSPALTITAPAVQITNLQEGDRNGRVTDEIEFQCNQSDVDTDDDISIRVVAAA